MEGRHHPARVGTVSRHWQKMESRHRLLAYPDHQHHGLAGRTRGPALCIISPAKSSQADHDCVTQNEKGKPNDGDDGDDGLLLTHNLKTVVGESDLRQPDIRNRGACCCQKQEIRVCGNNDRTPKALRRAYIGSWALWVQFMGVGYCFPDNCFPDPLPPT